MVNVLLRVLGLIAVQLSRERRKKIQRLSTKKRQIKINKQRVVIGYADRVEDRNTGTLNRRKQTGASEDIIQTRSPARIGRNIGLRMLELNYISEIVLVNKPSETL